MSSVQCRPNLADVSMVNEREIGSCSSDNKERLTIPSSVPIQKIISMENTNELSTQVRGMHYMMGAQWDNQGLCYVSTLCL